ncbi:hypothetical protein B0H66DRAFT_531397 [Apodospora peruviana]|uniref:Uncharacterized protein n=1 Tax=Apodospora peruviana TaxID=516989 RepID=A0AAE0IBF5_9PEZI|nr:hypothetical protein B0H66DRAFT_531397 [Apodospora peruviana]
MTLISRLLLKIHLFYLDENSILREKIYSFELHDSFTNTPGPGKWKCGTLCTLLLEVWNKTTFSADSNSFDSDSFYRANGTYAILRYGALGLWEPLNMGRLLPLPVSECKPALRWLSGRDMDQESTFADQRGESAIRGATTKIASSGPYRTCILAGGSCVTQRTTFSAIGLISLDNAAGPGQLGFKLWRLRQPDETVMSTTTFGPRKLFQGPGVKDISMRQFYVGFIRVGQMCSVRATNCI